MKPNIATKNKDGSSQSTGSLASALHARLLRATESKNPEQVRQSLREAIADTTSASDVFHLIAGANQLWNFAGTPTPATQASLENFADDLHAAANAAIQRNTTQIQQLRDHADTQVVCTPVSEAGTTPEVVAAVVSLSQTSLPQVLFAMELAGNYQRLWSRGNQGDVGTWKLNSLSAIIELVSEVQSSRSLEEAGSIAADQTAAFLGCKRVAIAIATERGPRVIALSGQTAFDENSETVRLIREVASECMVRDDTTAWPPGPDQTAQANRAHRTFAESFQFDSVLSSPLNTLDGTQVGAWLFAGLGEPAARHRIEAFVRTASPRMAVALDAVKRSNRTFWQRSSQKIRDSWTSSSGRSKWIAAGVLCGLMLVPLPYRVRCRCVLEPVKRQFAVAPFDGLVEEGLVQAGDIVERGNLLARMDGREISMELSGARAKQGQAGKQRDVDLAERDVPKAIISQLESQRLDSQIELLEYRRDHLAMRSPIDGVVLRAEIEKSQSAPVQTGQMLYEVGPLEELRIEVEIPATDVSHVRPGQKVRVWIDGLETESITGKIDRLRPRSELREDQNVFVAEVLIANPDNKLRPGMRGSARITGALRPIGWNLFHKPWEFVVSRLTWW